MAEEDAAIAGARIVDPRAVRVSLAGEWSDIGVDPVIVEPPAIPVAPAPRIAGPRLLGGIPGRSSSGFDASSNQGDDWVLVDSLPMTLRLERFDAVHWVLVQDPGGASRRTALGLVPMGEASEPPSGTVRVEVMIDGWSVVLEIESERRAALHERARRGRAETARGGPTEVRAIIPGKIVSVSVTAGDAVQAGQQLLVVEAMKMQNELRAPRDGVVLSVAVRVGATIEVGDPMLVLE